MSITEHAPVAADVARRRAPVLLGLALLCLATAAVPLAAPVPTARAMYNRAAALDRAVRSAMSAPSPAQPTRAQFRVAMSAYQQVVWQHPTSGYCDNALWQASLLAIEAFDRFGHEPDRLSALRFLRMLVREYPVSGFVRRARAAILRVENLSPSPATGVVVTPVRPAAVPASTPPGPARRSALPERAPVTPPKLVTIQQVQRTASAEATQIVVHLDGPVTFREERIENPARVFFDLAGTAPSDGVKDTIMTFESGLVRQLRVGRHPNSVTRLVLDADGVERHRAEWLDSPPRLVITCWPALAAVLPTSSATVPASSPGALTVSTAPATTAPSPTWSLSPGATATPATAPALSPPPPLAPAALQPSPTAERPAPVVAPAAVPAANPPALTPVAPAAAPALLRATPTNTSTNTSISPVAPSSNLKGGYSLARQLGLGASRIVIDAGHGGHDPGAIFRTNTEAAITLDVALRLEKLLLKQPGLEIVLTRRTDVFVPLQERTEIANREGADLFVSIHVNASENRSARGVETYLLDFASSPDDEAIAARENASSMMTMSHLNDLVKQIALTTKADESRDLALQVQRSLVRRLRPHNRALRDLGVKRAPFVVLIGASMPSVLVEVAFLTHRQEGRLIAGPTYRQRVADSIAEGIHHYQQTLKKGSPVARRGGQDSQATPVLEAPGRDRLQ